MRSSRSMHFTVCSLCLFKKKDDCKSPERDKRRSFLCSWCKVAKKWLDPGRILHLGARTTSRRWKGKAGEINALERMVLRGSLEQGVGLGKQGSKAHWAPWNQIPAPCWVHSHCRKLINEASSLSSATSPEVALICASCISRRSWCPLSPSCYQLGLSNKSAD